MKSITLSSEADWIKKAQRGDQLAFRHLVDLHAPQVRKTVVGMMGDTAEAVDLAQEVFIRLHKSLPKYRGEAQLATYLHRIAINLCLSALKKRQKRQLWNIAISPNNERQVKQIADHHNHAKQSELQDAIQQAMAQLEPEFRAVVVLRLMQGYSLSDTATMLQVPEGTVASRLSRAQKKLRTVLRKSL